MGEESARINGHMESENQELSAGMRAVYNDQNLLTPIPLASPVLAVDDSSLKNTKSAGTDISKLSESSAGAGKINIREIKSTDVELNFTEMQNAYHNMNARSVLQGAMGAAFDLGQSASELTAKLQRKMRETTDCLVVRFRNHASEKGLSLKEVKAEEEQID